MHVLPCYFQWSMWQAHKPLGKCRVLWILTQPFQWCHWSASNKIMTWLTLSNSSTHFSTLLPYWPGHHQPRHPVDPEFSLLEKAYENQRKQWFLLHAHVPRQRHQAWQLWWLILDPPYLLLRCPYRHWCDRLSEPSMSFIRWYTHVIIKIRTISLPT